MEAALTDTDLRWLRSWLAHHVINEYTTSRPDFLLSLSQSSSSSSSPSSTSAAAATSSASMSPSSASSVGSDVGVTDDDAGGFRIGANLTFDDLASIINQTRIIDHWFDPLLESSLICAYVFVITAGLCSNSVICFVVASAKSLRTASNLFIVNLAVSDLVMCLFCMPLTLVKLLLKNWPLGDALCRLTPWLQAANVFASTITITAIALDRYRVILSPSVRSRRRRLAGAVCLVVVIWLLAGLVGLPLAVYSAAVEETYFVLVTFTMCIERWPSSEWRFVYAAFVMLLQFVLPISILAAVHWRISDFLKRRIDRSCPGTLASVRSTMREMKRHRKNTSLLMAITIMYAVCWFPLTLLNFLADFNYSLFMYRNFLLAYAIAHLVAMTSAIANPVLYGWYNTNFKREFRQTIRFWRPPDRRQGAPREAGCRQALRATSALNAPAPAKRFSYKSIQTEADVQTLARSSPHTATQTIADTCELSQGKCAWYCDDSLPED